MPCRSAQTFFPAMVSGLTHMNLVSSSSSEESSFSPKQPDPSAGNPERARILDLCLVPITVAELASAVRLPLGVVRVLLDDLVREGLIDIRTMAPRGRVTDRGLLQKVLDGLHAL